MPRPPPTRLRAVESPGSGCCGFFVAPPLVYIGDVQPGQAAGMASSSGLLPPPPCPHWYVHVRKKSK